MTSEPEQRPVLTVVACGAGPAVEVAKLVSLAQERGWKVDLIATPAAIEFLDLPKLEAMTGTPVRTRYAAPAGSRNRSLSRAKAVVVAPATYNTICKLALGVNDTYALGVIAEAIGLGTPVVVLPFVNSALANRHPFSEAVKILRSEGVHVLLGEHQWTPHPPGHGAERIQDFPWHLTLEAL